MVSVKTVEGNRYDIHILDDGDDDGPTVIILDKEGNILEGGQDPLQDYDLTSREYIDASAERLMEEFYLYDPIHTNRPSLYTPSDIDMELGQFFRVNFGFKVHILPEDRQIGSAGTGGVTYGLVNPVSLAWKILYDRSRETNLPLQLYLPGFEPEYIMFANPESEYHTGEEVVKFEDQVVDALKLLRKRKLEFGNEEQIRAIKFLESQVIENYVLHYSKNHILI